MSRTTVLLSLEDVYLLARQLHQNVEKKDRRHRLKSYPTTFLGCDAVAWLMKEVPDVSSTAEALQLGNRMIRMKLFHHVYDDHLLENSKLFYRFYDDEPGSGSNGSSSSTESPTKNKVTVDGSLDAAVVSEGGTMVSGGEGESSDRSGGGTVDRKLLSTQQQLIQFRLESQGTTAHLEEELRNLQQKNATRFFKLHHRMKEMKEMMRILFRIVLILFMIVIVLACWQPLISGWFGYITVLACVLYGFWHVDISIRSAAFVSNISIVDLIMNSEDREEEMEDEVEEEEVEEEDFTTGRRVDEGRDRHGDEESSSTATLTRLPPIMSWRQQPLLLRTHDNDVVVANQVKTTVYIVLFFMPWLCFSTTICLLFLFLISPPPTTLISFFSFFYFFSSFICSSFFTFVGYFLLFNNTFFIFFEDP